MDKTLTDITHGHSGGQQTNGIEDSPRNNDAPVRPASSFEDGELPARVVALCQRRGWSMHWTHRGAYLHLESSELIEAIRGKHGDPTEEAGDVLLVLMSITEYAGIPFWKVLEKATAKLTHLENAPHYPGEELEPED